MAFGASSLPPLHSAVPHSYPDDSSTLCVPHSSAVKPCLRLASGKIDSREGQWRRDKREEVRLETSDPPRNEFGAQVVIILIALIYYGAKIINFVLLPITTVIIMVVFIAFRL